MNPQTLASPAPIMLTRILTLARFIESIQRLIGPLFTLFFLLFALFFSISAVTEFVRPIVNNGDLVEGLIKGLHMGVVALAVYELGQIIYQEYDAIEPPECMVWRIRRGIIRFVSVACTALVLDSLILVIKYSQKDLAGFLYYPVAIIVSVAILLVALGLFAKLTIDINGNNQQPVLATA